MLKLSSILIVTHLVLVAFSQAQMVELDKLAPKSEHISMDNSARALDQINSLEFNSGWLNNSTLDNQNTETLKIPQVESATRKLKTSNRQAKKRRQASGEQSIGKILVGLLSQLEKVDVPRVISDSMAQLKYSQLSGVHYPRNLASNNSSRLQANQSAVNGSQSRPKERVNASALNTETGNLLSITKQIVKLARTNLIGSDFGPLNSWMSPSVMMPTMVAAASQMLHDSGNSFTGASSKSDWLWMIAPAVIVVGSGVIVIPLIAAWLVSQLMSQNAFTASAGRRRRRREAYGQDDGLHSAELLKLLDLHQVLKESPEILVAKLSRLYSALDKVGSMLATPIGR